MKLLSVIISLLLIFSSGVFANDPKNDKQAPNPDCPLDYFHRGYDFVKGNPANDGSDPGWRLDVLLPIEDDHCLTCSYADSCKLDYEVREMETEIDYQERLFFDVFVSGNSEGFLKSVAFTGSGEFEYQREDIFGAGFVNIQAEGICQIFDGGRSSFCTQFRFSPTFLSAVATIPLSTEEPNWFSKVEAIFKDFGTHIIGDYISLGAKVTYESLFTTANYEGLRGVNIEAAATLSAEFLRTNEASESLETEEEQELRLMFEKAAEEQHTITLGALPPESLDFGDWAEGIENPLPIKHSLKPISELLTPELFPDDPNIERKRAVMEAAYELYCDSVPGCGLPQPPQPNPIPLLYPSVEDVGRYEVQNSLSVSCPANYLLVGGGCQSEIIEDPYFWHITSLRPAENDPNTYNCVVSKDRGENPHEYKGLTVSATCLHKSYVEDIQTIPCDGKLNYPDSYCTAVCPSDYQITGGGCETKNYHPESSWKVTSSNPFFDADTGRSGWNCRASQDEGSENGARYAARGFAICAKYADDKVKDQEILSERSGMAEEYTNGRTVSCAPGYELMGGGCTTLGASGSNKEWKIVETLPLRDHSGWSCVGQKDLYTGTTHQDVQTDAICVRL